MTKNEILEYFKDINHAYNDCTRYDTLKRMLDELEQEPCGDAISRQAVNKLQKYRYNCGDMTITCVSLNSINELPPVTPQYTDAEIQKMQDLEFAEIQKAYEIGKDEGSEVLDKIRAEIEKQEKWLSQAGYTAYNADIAFSSIKSVLAESEVSDANSD